MIPNGPGELLKGALDATSSMAFKLYDAGDLGAQLQLRDGSASVVGTDTKLVTLGDGTVVTLNKPKFAITLKSGAAEPEYSARVARKVIGMGLLEAIDERTILSRADQKDCNMDGISGRPSFVKDPVSGVLRVGRFGWKAEKVDVKHQAAEAAFLDMGVGTSLFQDGGKAELADDDLNRLVTYLRLVSVPGQRNRADAKVAQGEQIFRTVGCSSRTATCSCTTWAKTSSDKGRPLLSVAGRSRCQRAGSRALRRRAPFRSGGRRRQVCGALVCSAPSARTPRDRVATLPAADREALLAFVSSL